MSSNTINAAIMILTQNNIQRKVYLKTTLYFLFKNFNEVYKYPIIILHEGDYKERDIEEIMKSIRGNENKNLIKFKKIEKQHFSVPEHINLDKLSKSVNTQIVPYWRNIKYRTMCNFWLQHFTKYCSEYEYVMRLDDDSFIEEPLINDLFKICKDSDANYMSNIAHIDCGICNYGMKELFTEIFPDKKDNLHKLFVDADLKNNMEVYNKFKNLYKIINETDYDESNTTISMPIIYYNNFFITKVSFWEQQAVKDVIKKIDETGNIFYYRYGDAPLQTLIISLFSADKIIRTVFKYSKRLQRECFIDLDNNIHSYMPGDYDKTSCIFDKK